MTKTSLAAELCALKARIVIVKIFPYQCNQCPRYFHRVFNRSVQRNIRGKVPARTVRPPKVVDTEFSRQGITFIIPFNDKIEGRLKSTVYSTEMLTDMSFITL